MIVVRLRGGLGNQLFQFAAGYSLALHKGVELKSDLYTYIKHPLRKYELKHFNIELPEASRDEVHRFTGSNFLVRYLNKKNNYFNCPAVFAQPHYHFYEDFFSLPAPLYLSGYWQSEKYFSNVAGPIRKLITPSATLDAKNKDLVASMGDVESVAIHIRRTDYNPSSFFQPMGLDYYQRALNTIQQKIANPRYYIFSDDISWSRQQLKDLPGAVFIDHNKGDDSFKDLLVMSSCRHQVIANSTFSWWAAWLNDYPGKTVIAPQTWFHNTWVTKKEPVYPCRFYNTKDLVPSSWIRL
ncbi:MAG TPA: alpha-1,2-fucosyltransferase [Cyclobacteriaceae bacterium]|nr:alpha-1,2-fucosyltransferase [Cyclobacteriaceae bacterium]